jgi:hypothetical protein
LSGPFGPVSGSSERFPVNREGAPEPLTLQKVVQHAVKRRGINTL